MSKINSDVELKGSTSIQPPFIQAVAAVVPAYNEAGRIGKVLDVLCRVECLSEIIVVDDGSNDATSEEAYRASWQDGRLRVVKLPKNRGKGSAVLTGWQESHAPYLLLLDADLINLNAAHVLELIEPVISGQADMSLGLFKKGDWRSDVSHRLTPWLSGQRCLRAELLEYISRSAAEGYGFETALTVAARQRRWRQVRVSLVGVKHPLGNRPRGGYHGLLNRLKMYARILRAWRQAMER